MPRSGNDLRRIIRALLLFFIAGLVLSGVTAFPLLREMDILAALLGPATGDGDVVAWWIQRVHLALSEQHRLHPFMAYGTDWLAFGHLVIALFFVGPYRDPVRNAWVIDIGLIACAGVIPLALICGQIREIPFYWRLIDCSFGVFGALPLWCARLLISELKKTERLGGEPQQKGSAPVEHFSG
jgi:hypothetical protein